MNILFPFLVLLAFNTGQPGPFPGGCDHPKAHEFDFWIGEWDIEQSILQKDSIWLSMTAITSVEPVMGGCAILEQWDGEVQFFWSGMTDPEPMKALSLRYYNAVNGYWEIYWMDTRNMRLGDPFTGNFRDGTGIFERTTGAGGSAYISQIRFTSVSEDEIHWELRLSPSGSNEWRTLWIMEMQRR